MQSTEKTAFNFDENFDWTFKDESPKNHVHGLHIYPARMHPPVARKLIELFASEGDIVLDPFCGSGGVLAEAKIQGFQSIGLDINPLACLLSRAKTTPINPDVIYENWTKLSTQINELLEKKPIQAIAVELEKISKIDNKKQVEKELKKVVKDFLKNNVTVSDLSENNILYWFKPKAIVDLAVIESCIRKIPNEKIKEFFQVCFSKTARFVCGTRNGEFKMYRIPVEKWETFNPNTIEVFRGFVKENIVKMAEYFKFFHEKNQNAKSTIIQADTRRIFNDDFPEAGKKILFEKNKNGIRGKVNLIVTSPPYGDSMTTVAYGQFSKFLSFWLGYKREEYYYVDKESLGGREASGQLNSPTLEKTLAAVGSKDEKRATVVNSFFVDLNSCLVNLFKIMALNGKACFVVGNRTVKRIQIPTDTILVELAKAIGFEYIDTFSRSIPTKRIPWKSSPTNIAGKKVKTMSEEKIVIFEKIE